MKRGYARVSTTGQDLQSQINRLSEEGCKIDYCGPIAPSGRILAPPNADRNSMRAEGAPL